MVTSHPLQQPGVVMYGPTQQITLQPTDENHRHTLSLTVFEGQASGKGLAGCFWLRVPVRSQPSCWLRLQSPEGQTGVGDRLLLLTWLLARGLSSSPVGCSVGLLQARQLASHRVSDGGFGGGYRYIQRK